MPNSGTIGRTIQLFLVDGQPGGLIVASIHGWTGNVLVSKRSTFGRLLARPELDGAGVYIFSGQNADTAYSRAYIGEADNLRARMENSARGRGFWETAVAITTSDGSLTKGLVRYLEARLIEIANAEGRVALENTQMPNSERRRLPEAERSNMEAFLSNLRVILPAIGLDLLRPGSWVATGGVDYRHGNRAGICQERIDNAALNTTSAPRKNRIIDFIAAALKHDPNGRLAARDLYACYKGWCVANQVGAVSQTTLGRELSKAGFSPEKSGIVFRLGVNWSNGIDWYWHSPLPASRSMSASGR